MFYIMSKGTKLKSKNNKNNIMTALYNIVTALVVTTHLEHVPNRW